MICLLLVNRTTTTTHQTEKVVITTLPISQPRIFASSKIAMLSPSNNNELIIATHSLISTSLPSHRTIHHHRHHRSLAMCRPYPSITANDSRGGSRLLSASIPLPQSHIHRTPSELQLADDILRAEYEDVRMCVRLVSGMRSRCLVSGYVHPRTMQSVQDILKTKRADENQLELLEHQKPLSEHVEEEEQEEEEVDADWVLAYEEEDISASCGTPMPCHPHPLGMMSSSVSTFVIKSPSDDSSLSACSSYQSKSGNGSNRREDSTEDDECVFCLEL